MMLFSQKKGFLFLIALGLMVWGGCGRIFGGGGVRAEDFKGSWVALWSLTDSVSLALEDTLRYSMDGRIHFIDDRKARVQAYGCPNCVMGKDTTDNVLLWRFSHDTLWLGDDPMLQLGYAMKEKKGDTLYMEMLNQIQLALSPHEKKP